MPFHGSSKQKIKIKMNNLKQNKYGNEKQALITGYLLVVFGIFISFFFGFGIDGDAVFKLSRPRDTFVLPNLVVPASEYNILVSFVLIFLGARIILRRMTSYSSLYLGAGLFLLVTCFLVWATAGKSFSLTGMMQATVIRATPIALAALAGILSERVAIINIGIEGMLLVGAFSGAVFGSLFGGLIGLIFAIIVGGLFGLLHALLVIKYRVDQIISGVAINILALGLTSFLTSSFLKTNPELNDAPIFRPIKIPFLSDIPVLGPTLFQQNFFVYGAIILVLTTTYYIFKTGIGLRLRAVGEHPKAADTLGVNVLSIRYINVTLAGMVAGFGGAWFTLGSVGRFDEAMTGGRGFIGLAAMIFGRWHPVGALMAALIFGFADSLQQKLAILKTPIPSEFLAMAPYIATIVFVAGLIGTARAPHAIGKPYIKE